MALWNKLERIRPREMVKAINLFLDTSLPFHYIEVHHIVFGHRITIDGTMVFYATRRNTLLKFIYGMFMDLVPLSEKIVIVGVDSEGAEVEQAIIAPMYLVATDPLPISPCFQVGYLWDS